MLGIGSGQVYRHTHGSYPVLAADPMSPARADVGYNNQLVDEPCQQLGWTLAGARTPEIPAP